MRRVRHNPTVPAAAARASEMHPATLFCWSGVKLRYSVTSGRLSIAPRAFPLKLDLGEALVLSSP